MSIDIISALPWTCSDEQLFGLVERTLTEMYYDGTSADQLHQLVIDLSYRVKVGPSSLCA